MALQKFVFMQMCVLSFVLCARRSFGKNGYRDNGWKQVELFIGKQSLGSDPVRLWHSQKGQDRVIQEKIFFGRKSGYFVDLAANDPVRISNTYSLERDFAWEGLCIEANPIYFWRLALRNCSFIGAVIGSDTSELVTFHMPFGNSEGGLGGIVSNGTDNKPGKVKYNGFTMQFETVSLAAVLDRMGAPSTIDYLSLDVEGAEEMVLRHFPFEKWTFLVITIERPSRFTHNQLKKEGYTFVAMLGSFGDCMYVHRDIPNKGMVLAGTRHYRQLSTLQRRWAYVLS